MVVPRQQAGACSLRELSSRSAHPSLNGQRDLKDASVVVQGFGNVGYHAAKFLSEEDGARVIIVAERNGYVINPKGLRLNR